MLFVGEQVLRGWVLVDFVIEICHSVAMCDLSFSCGDVEGVQ